jgi:hypothetical protein
MKIEIDFDKEAYIESSAVFLKQLIAFLYKWLTIEGEGLGYILACIHFILFTSTSLMVVVSHILYPNFWLQLFMFCVMFTIWIQHFFLKVCVSIVAEQEFLQAPSPFYTLVEDILHISTSDFVNYYIVAETTALVCMALGLISRVSIYMRGWSSQL